MDVTFSVNGERVRLDVEPRHTLADTLREDCGLTVCVGPARSSSTENPRGRA
jgi:aerobic-type carbon monoxide dehydrogenase small subunit (CoxS/CutS family)